MTFPFGMVYFQILIKSFRECKAYNCYLCNKCNKTFLKQTNTPGKKKKRTPNWQLIFFWETETSTTLKKKCLGSLVVDWGNPASQNVETESPLKIFGKIWGSQTSLITGHQALHQRKPITWGIGQLLVGPRFFGSTRLNNMPFSLFLCWCLGWAVVIVLFWRDLTETTFLEGHCTLFGSRIAGAKFQNMCWKREVYKIDPPGN